MSPRTAFLALLLLAAVAVAAPPCDRADPDALCLKPLRRAARRNPASPDSLPGTVRRRGGGGRGGRGSSFGRRPGAVAAGAAAGAILGSGRRPGRRGSRGVDDDDEPFSTDEDAASAGGDAEGAACFPAAARVTVRGRGTVPIASLRVGDEVLVAPGRFSPVYMFSHRVARRVFPFVRVETAHAALTVSEGHYIFADGKLVAAGALRPGDRIELADGRMDPVLSVRHVTASGLYNPHTLDGELIVDGVRASVYTSSVDPAFANTLLAPVRAAFRFLGVDITLGSLADDVSKTVLNRLPSGPAATEL